jgi:hypothetical protein
MQLVVPNVSVLASAVHYAIVSSDRKYMVVVIGGVIVRK